MPRKARSEWSRAAATLRRIRSEDMLNSSLSCFPTLPIGAPAKDWLARRRGLIEATARRQDRRRPKTWRSAGVRGGGERLDRGYELVERRLAFAFGWLDEHRAVHDQREVHRHRMIPLVDQRLGKIERRDPRIFQKTVVEQYFMHAEAGEREAEVVLQPSTHIIGVQYRIFRHL